VPLTLRAPPSQDPKPIKARGKRVKGQQDKDNKTKTKRLNKVGKTNTRAKHEVRDKSKEPRHKRRETRDKKSQQKARDKRQDTRAKS
jgi:hypothetical protein